MKQETINSNQFGAMLTKALHKVATMDVKKQKTQEDKAIKKMQTKSPQPLGWFKDKKAFDTYLNFIGSIHSPVRQKLFKQRCREKFEAMMFGPIDGHEYYLTDTMIVEIYHNILNHES